MNKQQAMRTIYEMTRDKRLREKKHAKSIRFFTSFALALLFFLILGVLGGIMQ